MVLSLYLMSHLLQPLPASAQPALPQLPPAAEEAPRVAEPSPAAAAGWTVLYFMNGKNDLESSALMDMNQLELSGSTPELNIVAEMGRMNGQEYDDNSDGDWTGVRRYLVTKDTDTARIASPVLEHRAAADMGSWKELADFLRWAKAAYPARRYALVLWDHGNGWEPVDQANAGGFYDLKGFSLDEETGHEFSLPQMAEALRRAGGVDFLMLDGCNMGMAEVAYELKDSARAMTASEETEPGVVVRYAQFLGMLNARPQMDAEELASNTVKTYRDFFLGMAGDNEGAPATQSAVRLYEMRAFREKLDAWAGAAMKADPAALRLAAARAKFFGEYAPYKDLCDFVSLAGEASGDPRLKALGRELVSFVKDRLVIENWAQDAVSHGVAIDVPSSYDDLYDGLSLSRDSVWDDFARLMASLK
ncbi:MAG: clostripain-related cysteine peptidase [Elusimicrobia bacterium]|nr:clostripain-related cysteine peptidase [Elusimicrobiota bacterium]